MKMCLNVLTRISAVYLEVDRPLSDGSVHLEVSEPRGGSPKETTIQEQLRC